MISGQLSFVFQYQNMKHILLNLFLFTYMNAYTQQSNDHFSHTISTTATPETIWKIWTDVSNWKQWDRGLKDARLTGVFTTGSKGKLIPDKGPVSTFVITEVSPNKSYSFKTRIPFGWLIITRSLEVNNGITSFTHDVQFTGLFKKSFGKKLGSKYRQLLPSVMEKIKELAESR